MLVSHWPAFLLKVWKKLKVFRDGINSDTNFSISLKILKWNKSDFNGMTKLSQRESAESGRNSSENKIFRIENQV
jgi:hypothetical protein